jgi:GAF domain-containing protein
MPATQSSKPDVLREADALAASADSAEELMQGICELLSERMPNYNWVGFYMLQETRGEPLLVLGPYVGAATPHTRIPLNQGICGAAASTGETVVVDDVNSDPRYLACSIETKSEIVVPVYANGRVVGELDIDSHVPAAFAEEDRRICEHCAQLVGKFLERSA